MNIATTHLVEYVPYRHRNERCVVALLTYRPGQGYGMHICEPLKKARAIHPAYNLTALRDGLHAIAAELQQTPQALALYADGATGITISPRAGRITYRNDAEFFDGLRWALSVAVNPIEPIRSRERVPVSRLFIQIKNTFDTLGWMAPIGQGISQGRIISRYSLSPDEGLTVDFAQQEQDKTFLAVQTIDYRHNASAKRTEASAKLLTLGMAEQFINAPRKQRLAVFAGTDAPEARTGIRLAERVSNDVFVEESADDMRRFMDIIAHSLGQSPLPTLQMH